MDTKLLLEAGLTEGEVKVYLALLEIGETTTGPLIRKAKVSASKCYDILERLIQKGLASTSVKANMKHFTAADPKRILDYVKEREQDLAEKRQQLMQLVPELNLRRALAEHATSATVFEGFKGMKTAFQQILDEIKKGDAVYILGAYGGVPLSTYRPFFKKWHDERSRKGVTAKMIFNQRVKDTIGKDREATPLTQVKYMPPTVITPATIEIYHDYTIIALLTEQPLVVRIKNKSIAESFKEYFDLLWNEQVTVYHGLEGIKHVFRQTLEYKESRFIGGKGFVLKRAPDFFWNEYVPEAEKRGHVWLDLGQPGIMENKDIAQLSFAKVRYLPKTFATPHVIFLYGNHVANVLWEKEPIAYVITDAAIAKSYREYFDMLWNQENRTLQGFEGIQALCEEVVQTGKDLYLIGANGALYNKRQKFFFEFDKRRLAKNIVRHHLAIEVTRNSPINKQPNTQVRYLPKEFNSPMVIWIFGDNVANILWDDEIVYLTQNRKIADDYRKYFQLLWKGAKK